jgi:hypothetical protein
MVCLDSLQRSARGGSLRGEIRSRPRLWGEIIEYWQ